MFELKATCKSSGEGFMYLNCVNLLLHICVHEHMCLYEFMRLTNVAVNFPVDIRNSMVLNNETKMNFFLLNVQSKILNLK